MNGATVSAFERELASYCGATYAIAAANGTVTLQAALVALGVKPGDLVAVPPLTMSATTIAVLNVGAVPHFIDVDARTWLMSAKAAPPPLPRVGIPVSLYGLHQPYSDLKLPFGPLNPAIDDAAQTLRKHNSGASFTSLSFQASKILSLGEGGALLTNDEELASRARSYLSLGYRMAADQARIDPTTLKSPTYDRHHTWPAINGRMNDVTAERGLKRLVWADRLVENRRFAAGHYQRAIAGCEWLTRQHVPEGWTHDYWTYAVACDTPERAQWLAEAVHAHGGERPYPAWRLTYHEPAFRHLAPRGVCTLCETSRPSPLCPDCWLPRPCPVAESLQPRLLQFQTNDLASAERNAKALRAALRGNFFRHCTVVNTGAGIPCG